MGLTGTLAAAAAIPRTAGVHHTAHHTFISLSATRSASSLLGNTTPCDAFDTGHLGQSHPSCRAPIQSIFQTFMVLGALLATFAANFFFEAEEDKQEATTSLALAKDMDVGFAVKAVFSRGGWHFHTSCPGLHCPKIFLWAFPWMYFWGKSIQPICLLKCPRAHAVVFWVSLEKVFLKRQHREHHHRRLCFQMLLTWRSWWIHPRGPAHPLYPLLTSKRRTASKALHGGCCQFSSICIYHTPTQPPSAFQFFQIHLAQIASGS